MHLRGTPLKLETLLFAYGGPAAGVTMFVPTISTFIGFPSSWTLLYLTTADNAS